MSIVRNRELSQFGSFIYIDNTSQEIGIATETTPYVGIGTANPSVKFHVVGDTNIEGNLNVSNGNIDATSYTLNGNPLVDAAVSAWDFGLNSEIYRLNGNIGIGFSNVSEKVTVNGNVSAAQFISTVTSGTPPLVVYSDTQVANLNASFLGGKLPPTGAIVGTTDIQTLTNKTLISPTIISPNIPSGDLSVNGNINITNGNLRLYGSISGITTLTAAAVAGGTLTLPAVDDTLIGRNTTDSLTNKTISANFNAITGLTNSNLSGSAGITTSNLAQYTISGVSLGSNLQGLSFGSYINSSGSYDGSTARTVSIAGTSLNVINTLVARDSLGNFSAASINCSYLNASFDINSNSDENIKKNIETIRNPLQTVSQLRGVTFNWKENERPSIGVIAQELEQVLPQLVKDGEIKAVNYNGLIGVLIEAVKELSQQVEELKNQINN